MTFWQMDISCTDKRLQLSFWHCSHLIEFIAKIIGIVEEISSAINWDERRQIIIRALTWWTGGEPSKRSSHIGFVAITLAMVRKAFVKIFAQPNLKQSINVVVKHEKDRITRSLIFWHCTPQSKMNCNMTPFHPIRYAPIFIKQALKKTFLSWTLDWCILELAN